MSSIDSRVLCALAAGPQDLETLANRLGADRESLDAAVSTLSQEGWVAVEADRVALDGPIDYGVEELEALTPEPYTTFLRTVVGSTNRWVAELVERGHERVLAVAERQRGGRGRRGRTWRSPPGGIWASLGDGRPRPAETGWVEGLALAVATAEAVRTFGLEATLKWPNDVVIGERKLAGILVEATTGERRDRTICGVGINANVDPDDLPPGAIALRERLGSVARAPVLGHVVHMFESYRQAPEATLESWRAQCATLGRSVRVELADGRLDGTAVGLTEAGALVVESASGVVTVRPERCRQLRHR